MPGLVGGLTGLFHDFSPFRFLLRGTVGALSRGREAFTIPFFTASVVGSILLLGSGMGVGAVGALDLSEPLGFGSHDLPHTLQPGIESGGLLRFNDLETVAGQSFNGLAVGGGFGERLQLLQSSRVKVN